jgi:hypothetical protein
MLRECDSAAGLLLICWSEVISAERMVDFDCNIRLTAIFD